MKAAEARGMKVEDLNHELIRLERHLFDLRAQAVTEKLADPTQLGKTRRDIARVLTILREKTGSATPPTPKSVKPAAKASPAKPAAAKAPAKTKSAKAKK